MCSFWWTHSLYSVVGTRLFRLFTDTQKHRGTERERDLQFFPHSSGSRQLPFYELPRFLTVFKVVGWCCVNLCDLYCCWSKQDKAELASPFFLFFCRASKMWAWFENGVGLNSSQELSGRKRTNLFPPSLLEKELKGEGIFLPHLLYWKKALGGIILLWKILMCSEEPPGSFGRILPNSSLLASGIGFGSYAPTWEELMVKEVGNTRSLLLGPIHGPFCCLYLCL